MSFLRMRESMDSLLQGNDNSGVQNSIRVICEVGEGPDCKTRGCREFGLGPERKVGARRRETW